jgi:hypothetical protein
VNTKKEVQEEMRAKLGKTEAQIEVLMAQATQSDYDEFLTDLRINQERAKAQLARLEEADDEAWQELKAELDRTVGAVQSALQVAAPESVRR